MIRSSHARDKVGKKTGTDANVTPALDRGLAILELLAARGAPMLANDLAQELELPNCSVGRILSNFVVRGYLERDERSRRYSLTGKLLAMAAGTLCERNLVVEAMDEMRALRDACGESVQINALSGDNGVVLETAPSRHAVRFVADPGTPFPLHNTAPGKVLLVHMKPDDREVLLRRTVFASAAGRKGVTVNKVRAELDHVRKSGYGLDVQEYLLGVHCVSAPIFARGHLCVGALTVNGPVDRLPIDRLSELAPMVIAHAGRISSRLGCLSETAEQRLVGNRINE